MCEIIVFTALPMRGGTAYSILFKESRYTILDTFEEVSPATT